MMSQQNSPQADPPQRAGRLSTLSAVAAPWYPTLPALQRVRPSTESVSSQPIREDDFPTTPASSSRVSDEHVLLVPLKPEEASNEQDIIRHLVRRGDAYWEARERCSPKTRPSPKGGPSPAQQAAPASDAAPFEELPDDGWEDDPDAYDLDSFGSLEDPERQWIEEQLRPKDNPDDFFW